MSMYRQLWLAIVISTLLALLGSLLASTISARSYISEQLTMKNADNAAALALSLSQQTPDQTTVELAVAALFDSGHYELIRVTDPFGKILVERLASATDYEVPEWFSRKLPITAEPGRAQISNGWKQFGTIELVSHSRFAYKALWNSIWFMIASLAAAGLVGGYLGSLVLRRLREPLNAVIHQAQAITQRLFVTIPEPKVPELRKLAAAMNATVTRLKTMFEEEAARLEAVRREANCDQLTNLANRDNFLARLRAELADDDAKGGTLALIRVANLANINKRLGRTRTDELLKIVGAIIHRVVGDHREGLGARLNGADFAVLLPGIREAKHVADKLRLTLIKECHEFASEGQIAAIGCGCFPHGLELGEVLGKIDAALAAAELEGANSCREARFHEDEPQHQISASEWSGLIMGAIEHGRAQLGSFPVVDFSGRLIHSECPIRLKMSEHSEWLPAGQFISIAEQLKLTANLDMTAVDLGLASLAADVDRPDIAVNLSASSIQDKAFRQSLIQRLRQHAKICERLWLEVPEVGVVHHFESFRILVSELKSTGCRIGIEHFGRQSNQLSLLHNLGIDYLKVDGGFIRHIESNTGNQAFLKGLAGMAHVIGLMVIAEGVNSDKEFATLVDLGFDGATGPAIPKS